MASCSGRHDDQQQSQYTDLSGSGPRCDQIEFKGLELYSRLKKYILTEKQLRENRFPRPSEIGRYNKAQFYKVPLKDKERLCLRCGKKYNINEDGSPVEREMCFYRYTHLHELQGNERLCLRCGKIYKVNKDGSPVEREICNYHYTDGYRKQDGVYLELLCGCRWGGSRGCQRADSHVHKSNMYDDLIGYLFDPLPALESDPRNTRVVSLHCELVYTEAGMELARVIVIGDDCQVLYETLVKPETAILDYNTRFSGITAEDMEGVDTTIRKVHDVMRDLVSNDTILVGHGLESDLTALKMIHSTVVDTSILFPNRRGFPFKSTLRNLVADHLQKDIQPDDGGHDSKNDAVSCMQLVLFKVEQDAKTEARQF